MFLSVSWDLCCVWKGKLYKVERLYGFHGNERKMGKNVMKSEILRNEWKMGKKKVKEKLSYKCVFQCLLTKHYCHCNEYSYLLFISPTGILVIVHSLHDDISRKNY